MTDPPILLGVEARDRDRHPVADEQTGLLTFGDPQLWLSENLGVARSNGEIDDHARNVDEPVAARDVLELIEEEPAVLTLGAAHRSGVEPEVEGVTRQRHTEIRVIPTRHQQEFDIDQHFSFGLVVDGDEFLGDRHLVGGVAQGDGVELFIGRQPARLDE